MSHLLTRKTLRALLVVALLGFALLQWGRAGWIQTKAAVAQRLISSAWSETVETPGAAVKPWQWADTWPVARLQWQAADGTGREDQVVLANAQGESLAFGPSMIARAQDSGPGRWQVIAGHNDTHFRFLARIKAGDHLKLQDTSGYWQPYRIEHQAVYSADEPLLIDSASHALVLVTCYPFGPVSTGPEKRLVVYAEPVTPHTQILAF